MIIPEGLKVPSSLNLVCKLLKSLYGLKQSSRVLYQHLDNYLLLQSFHILESDTSITYKRQQMKIHNYYNLC